MAILGKITSAYTALTSTRAFVTTSKVYSAYCLYHVTESALSHLLVLDTCRHGTNLKNWTKINLFGFEPNRGGSAEAGGQASRFERDGADSGWAKKDQGYTYFVRDSRTMFFKSPLCGMRGKIRARYVARDFARQSTESQIPRCFGEVGGVILGAIGSLVSPTIKVHFRPEAAGSVYEQDPSMANVAVRTSQPIGWSYMGITGSLCQGLDKTLPKRIVNHPSRFLVGVAQGTLAVFVAAKMLGKPLSLPVPKQLHKLWEYRAFRWPIEYGIRFSAW